jgi:ABC-type dipeptide/oligopeptide/nickel transport system permease component
MQQNNYQITEKHHSRLGIASVIIGFGLPVLLVLFIIAGAFLGTRPGTTGNDIVVVLMLIALSFPLLHLIALVFGLVGIFSKKTKKLFPIIGTVVNGLLLVTGVLVIIFFAANLKFKG